MRDIVNQLKSAPPLYLGHDLLLRAIDEKYVSSAYVAWLNDYAIVKFTEQRFCKTFENDIRSYLQQMAENPAELMYGIFHNEQHIGNIKLGAINRQHRTANLSYLIGAAEHWGKGYASVAIAMITEVGFKDIGLDKICAGVYENNIASSRVLIKNKFVLEGRRAAQYVFESKRIDALLYARHRKATKLFPRGE